MIINYFHTYNGGIFESTIDTNDKNYISHTDESVTFIDSYLNQYWETQYHEVTRTRIFEELRQRMINNLKDRIKDLKKDLAVFEGSASYDRYKELAFPWSKDKT